MSRPRRVLFWTENYAIGGCDRYLVDVAQALDPKQWEVIFAGNANPRMDEYIQRAGIAKPRFIADIRSIPRTQTKVAEVLRKLNHGRDDALRQAPPIIKDDYDVKRFRQLLRPTINLAFTSLLTPGHVWHNYREMKAVLDATQPDIVHINNGGYPAAESCRLMAVAAHDHGVRTIVHTVHNVASDVSRPYWWDRRLDSLADSATNAWVTAAPYTSERLAYARGFDPKKIHTIFYGIPCEPERKLRTQEMERVDLGLSDQDLVFTMTASFEVRKGHAVLLDAVELLLKDVSLEQTRFILVGEGPLQEWVRNETIRRGITQHFIFTGWISNPELILLASDALILPSISHECLPYAILEAMQHQLPVIGTRIAGIPEQIIDGKTGFLIDPNDPLPLAQAIKKLNHEGTRKEMGRAGQNLLRQKFSLSEMIKRTIALWEE